MGSSCSFEEEEDEPKVGGALERGFFASGNSSPQATVEKPIPSRKENMESRLQALFNTFIFNILFGLRHSEYRTGDAYQILWPG